MSRVVLVATLLAAVLVPGSGLAGDVRVISHGEEVRLEDHLVDGRYVLFDFYADWCGPCRALAPTLDALADRHPDRLAVRKVDIVNGDSAVSRQHRVRFVPYLKLYGPDGTLIREGDARGVLDAATAALGGAPARVGDASPSLDGGRSSSLVPLLVLLVVVGAVAYLLLARVRRPAAPAAAPVPLRVSTAPDEPGAARVWFVRLQGALEGPFAVADLDGMTRRGQLSLDSEVRRRGDAEWRRLRDVVDVS